MNPTDSVPPPPPVKGPNSFQLIGAILAAAAGVRGISKRGRSFGEASTGAILGALLIFAAFLGLGFWAFVHAIKSAVPS
ncbi:MAG TPA: hypothetical protein VJM11_10445 [Nevskiaceae bacterium]|nr:hypothetical protein [Nevskiaceae bacterium]